MGERKFTKKRPVLKLSVTPERRKLAIIVALLTLGGVALDSDLLNIFSTDDSAAAASQKSDQFSELESMLAEFGTDAETPDTSSAAENQTVAAEQSSPLLIPSVDTPAEVPASHVSFPQQTYDTSTDAQPDDSPSASGFSGSGGYGFASPRPDHRASVTGIRFTGNIQPIQ